jgi:hypothetical protein
LRPRSPTAFAGDEQGWLAPVTSRNRQLQAEYRKQFKQLRALGVTSFQPVFDGRELDLFRLQPRRLLRLGAPAHSPSACVTSAPGGRASRRCFGCRRPLGDRDVRGAAIAHAAGDASSTRS